MNIYKAKKEKLRILYVGTAQVVVHNLSKSPDLFDFSYAENVFLAIDWLNESAETTRKLDAIVCESYLPGLRGLDLYKYTKKSSHFRKTPFILITHNQANGMREKALENKVDDLYVTPFKAKNLHTRISFLKRYKELAVNGVQPVPITPAFKMKLSKRLFDILFSILVLIALTPILALVALLIKLESKGPVYYISKRVGTGYRIFDFYKFRSMRQNADIELNDLEHLNIYHKDAAEENCEKCEQLGSPCSSVLYIRGEKICENLYLAKRESKINATFMKLDNDPRVTRIGRFIRKSSIDELPQFINVLKGDMSIVGNRPLPLYEAELLTSDQWSERFLSPAGITGLWQINYHNKDMDLKDRKELDNYYARNNSFLGDMMIILKTIPAMFQKKNL
ncbi:MAG: sugar transferase [Bacteroidetes bacterium]|nr:sugar transferase [Bacteroidota bacterium]